MIENKTIEFKREYTYDIKYAVITFVNTDSGKVYNDGTTLGVAGLKYRVSAIQ